MQASSIASSIAHWLGFSSQSDSTRFKKRKKQTDSSDNKSVSLDAFVGYSSRLAPSSKDGVTARSLLGSFFSGLISFSSLACGGKGFTTKSDGASAETTTDSGGAGGSSGADDSNAGGSGNGTASGGVDGSGGSGGTIDSGGSSGATGSGGSVAGGGGSDTAGSGGVSSGGVSGSGGTGGGTTVDCDAEDSPYIRLIENDTLYLSESATICPGTYNNAQLMITGSRIAINGEGVRINSEGLVGEQGLEAGVITFLNADEVTLTGFEIYNFGGSYEAVLLQDSSDNVLEDLTIRDRAVSAGDGIGPRGIRIFGLSSGNVIENSTLSSDGIRILADQDAEGTTIRETTIETNLEEIEGEFPGAIELSAALDYLIEGNTLSGKGVLVGFGADAVIRNNTITDSEYGVRVLGNSNRIEDNIIQYNNVGVFLQSGVNVVENNDLRFNEVCIEEFGGFNTLRDNQCQ